MKIKVTVTVPVLERENLPDRACPNLPHIPNVTCWKCHGTGTIISGYRLVTVGQEAVAVELDIDEQSIANRVANRAARNRNGRATAYGGSIKGRVLERRPIAKGGAS